MSEELYCTLSIPYPTHPRFADQLQNLAYRIQCFHWYDHRPSFENDNDINANACSAFSITSEVVSNGVCVTSPGPPTTLSSAYTQTLQSTNGRVILDPNGQRAFINFLGFTKCSNGGENVAATALIQVTNTTATMTSTFSNVPLAAVSATLTIAPVGHFTTLASPRDYFIVLEKLRY